MKNAYSVYQFKRSYRFRMCFDRRKLNITVLLKWNYYGEYIKETVITHIPIA